MDFLLWTARSLHVFSVVVWFGGLLYQAVVLHPVAHAELKKFDAFTLHFIQRFQPFVWMSVWTLCVTGIALMLFSPRFLLFQFHDAWSILLAVKQGIFLLMVFFSIGYARMFRRVHELVSAGEHGDETLAHFNQMMLFGRINVALAIGALLVAVGMHS